MPKSQIIKDLVEDNVPLEKSLTRLMVLAKDINNDKLADWAEKEIKGYPRREELPDYRIIESRRFIYSGFNGNYQVTDLPLPEAWMGAGVADHLAKINNYEGIKYLSELADSDYMSRVDLSRLAGNVAHSTDHMVRCTTIYQEIPQPLIQGICNAIKMKMLTALLELEKKYGCLDSLGIDISNRDLIQVKADNDALNKAVFNITLQKETSKKEPWYTKFAWNIIVPIITAVLGGLIVAIVNNYFAL